MARRRKIGKYFRVLAIPLVVMIVWSIIVFIIGVAGSLNVGLAGMPAVGAGLSLIGSLIGGLMALLVGFNAAKQDLRKLKQYAIAGALFGTILGIINGLLAIATSIFSLLTGYAVSSGLQGLSPSLVIEIIEALGLGTFGFSGLINFLIDTFGAIFVLFLSIITGLILAVIGGYLTKKLFD